MTGAEWLVAATLMWHAGVFCLLGVNLVFMARSRGKRVAPTVWPRVSVLVPARNEADNLRLLLPSLLGQDYPDAEFIVVDDASEDGTWGVITEHADSRLVGVRGDGPPPGWVGKVHALFQATRRATGEVFVFLDADGLLADRGALSRLVERWSAAGGAGNAVSGLPLYLDRGPGALMTSLVPFAVLAALPIPLVSRTANPAIGALNGQIWVIGAPDYRRLEPHESLKNEVLEDVMIGRLLKREGVRLHFIDLKDDLAVRMYGSFSEAWHGFRKNAYLLAGGTPMRASLFFLLYAFVWVLPTLLALGWLAGAVPLGWLPLVSLTLIKSAIDQSGRFPLSVSGLAPVALALGAALLIGSAWAHFRGTVAWKGRTV